MKTNLLITTLLAAGALTLPLRAQTPSASATPFAGTGTPAGSAVAASPAAGERMHYGGQVTAVDATAKTLTVHTKKEGDLSFTVTDSTKVTKTDGSAAMLSDVKVGDHAHGAYTKGSDGSMALLTLKVGASMKKADKQ